MPLGYDVRDRKLVVNEAEAAIARRVFRKFVEIGSGTTLTHKQNAQREWTAAMTQFAIMSGDRFSVE